jgi:hypothetical protein
MAFPAPPTSRRTKAPPSWWWFLGPVVLGALAMVVGAGAFLTLVGTVDTRYGEVRPDGEPHAVVVPTGQRVAVMVPADGNRTDWTCRVADSEGRPVPTTDPSGTLTLGGGESSSWESLATFALSDVDDAEEVTVYVACRTTAETDGSVLVAKAPRGGVMVAIIAIMVLGPILLGGAAVLWLVVLTVLHVVRRTGVAS